MEIRCLEGKRASWSDSDEIWQDPDNPRSVLGSSGFTGKKKTSVAAGNSQPLYFQPLFGQAAS